MQTTAATFPTSLALDELQNRVHDLILEAFKTHKRGYCWLHAKYGHPDDWSHSEKPLRVIIACLESKRDQTRCPLHRRVHGKPKL